jgi:hypothetical protein
MRAAAVTVRLPRPADTTAGAPSPYGNRHAQGLGAMAAAAARKPG